MRTTPRPRHPIRPAAFLLLRPVLRYSYTREAYVLRLVGNHRGPVFVRRPRAASPQATPPSATAGIDDGRRGAGAAAGAPTGSARLDGDPRD